MEYYGNRESTDLPFELDIQLFAEDDDADDDDLGNADLQDDQSQDDDLDDVDATDDDSDQDAEPTDDDEPGDDDQPDLFEVDGIEFDAPTLKEWRDAHSNMKKWRAKLSKEGEKQNKERKALSAERKEIEEIRGLAEEFKRAKQNMTPEAYEYLKKLMNEGDKVTPAVRQLKEDIDRRFKDLDKKEAIVSLKEQFTDFDVKAVQEFMESFDWEQITPYDVYLLGYYALQGKGLPEKIQNARAKDAETRRKRKGVLPSSKGTKKASNRKAPRTIDEGLEMALAELAGRS